MWIRAMQPNPPVPVRMPSFLDGCDEPGDGVIVDRRAQSPLARVAQQLAYLGTEEVRTCDQKSEAVEGGAECAQHGERVTRCLRGKRVQS